MQSETGLQLITSYPLNSSKSKNLITGLTDDGKPIVALKAGKKGIIYLDIEDWRTIQNNSNIFSNFFKKNSEYSLDEISMHNAIIFFEKFTRKSIRIRERPTWLENLLNYQPPTVTLIKNEYFKLESLNPVINKQLNYLEKLCTPIVSKFYTENVEKNQ